MPHLPPALVLQKIRAALVAEVAARGIGATSVGAVAKRAQVATGTIYLHFKSKQDMLQKVYLQIKTEFHGIVMAAANEPTTARVIRRMWDDMFAFVDAHPLDFMFIEYAGAAQVLNPRQVKSIAYTWVETMGVLQRAIDSGALVRVPPSVIATLLVAPAMHLARIRALHGESISRRELDMTFERVWRSIAADGADDMERTEASARADATPPASPAKTTRVASKRKSNKR